jgi:hypothetical protein
MNFSFSIEESSENYKNNTIITLNDSNFEEYKQKTEFLLIFIHATYSDQSGYLKSEFQKIPEHIKTNKKISYGFMTHKNPKTLKKYKIEGPFPKILLINKDKETNVLYKGDFETSSIFEWVAK